MEISKVLEKRCYLLYCLLNNIFRSRMLSCRAVVHRSWCGTRSKYPVSGYAGFTSPVSGRYSSTAPENKAGWKAYIC